MEPSSIVNFMATRRAPLTNNPHAANSPMRAPSALNAYSKQQPRRSFATMQREEPYGQPPPTKKQALEGGMNRPVRSPSKATRLQSLSQRAPPKTNRQPIKERSMKPAPTAANGVSREYPDENSQQREAYKKYYRAKFPKIVFYFESVPDETRAKLTKKLTSLGARQEPFFSIDVTHVITTRQIPSQPATGTVETQQEDEQIPEEQPQTINPSLLDRNNAARRKLLSEFRSVPSRSTQHNDPNMPSKGPRNNDVLYKARDMGKKIWSLEKFQNMLNVLLEADDTNLSNSRTTGSRSQTAITKSREPNLMQLLHHERMNGPSDRDMGTSLRELSYFKGPYIYIWDMDEKHKPIIVREYAKVTHKTDGDWPQFRSVGNGRCPFVDEYDSSKEERRKREQEQEQARAAAKQLKPPQPPAPNPVTGKRTLKEMEDGHYSRPSSLETFNPAKVALSKQATQNAFTSRMEHTRRVLRGEPVASGMQQSAITSAIQSQMISSASGISGVKAGTSKEIHGLQRKVLQKSAAPPSSRPVERSVDAASSFRSVGIARQTSKSAVDMAWATEDENVTEKRSQPLKSKKDLKPGYCENCLDKFQDFDQHILTRKHRAFAENPENWIELDSLLKEIRRQPRPCLPLSTEGKYQNVTKTSQPPPTHVKIHDLKQSNHGTSYWSPETDENAMNIVTWGYPPTHV